MMMCAMNRIHPQTLISTKMGAMNRVHPKTLSFIITIEDSNVIVTYKLHCGSLEKIHEEPASVTTDNEPKLNTMGIF